MYAKSLVVFALCTTFVLAFVVVLNYEATGVARQEQNTLSSLSTCPMVKTPCATLTITSADLRNVNYESTLGAANFTILTLGLNASGGTPIESASLFVGNASAGTIQGPFEPGVNKVLNLTLPATISVSPGEKYLVTVEGLYGNGTDVWASQEVIAH
jgi:hypothetical protein